MSIEYDSQGVFVGSITVRNETIQANAAKSDVNLTTVEDEDVLKNERARNGKDLSNRHKTSFRK